MKSIIGTIFFIFFVSLIFFTFGTGNTPPPAESVFKQNESILESVHLKQFNGNKFLFSISARKIIYRKRSYKVFIYKNLKELFIEGLSIDLYQTEDNGKKPALSSSQLVNVLSDFGNPQTSYQEFLRGSGDLETDLLTRILIADCSIHILRDNGAKIAVGARRARIVDFKNIILEGDVRIKNSNGAEISSAKAVWSAENNGFLFPEGYRSGDFQYQRKSFLKIGKSGDFYPAHPVQSVKYTDLFEEYEESLFDSLSQDAPPFLRHLIEMSESAI